MIFLKKKKKLGDFWGTKMMNSSQSKVSPRRCIALELGIQLVKVSYLGLGPNVQDATSGDDDPVRCEPR